MVYFPEHGRLLDFTNNIFYEYEKFLTSTFFYSIMRIFFSVESSL